mmetsp:Transcript_129358/g.360277  ORF Transcript_129358/g.360277 Transcript_129358/m.360277 type:complete len:371 (-) Transcript_129358:206-1318(-)
MSASYRLVCAAVLAGLASPCLAAANVSEGDTTYSGYMIDNYCYGLVSGGGRALDGADVIKDPGAHTWHCMRDPPICYNNGFYLAEKKGDEYHPKFKFDDAGNAAALALLRTRPEGHPQDNERGEILVTAMGYHDGDGYLREATIVQCLDGQSSCDSICTGNCEGSADIKLPPTALLWCHVLCMLASWGCLLPAGVIWARGIGWRNPKRIQGHRLIQMVGWLLQLVGFACIVAHKGFTAHFTAPHEVLGLIVVILGTLQPINAQLRHLKGVGHPAPDGSRTALRKKWEYLHKGCGYVAVIAGPINVILGVLYAHKFGFGGGLVPAAAALCGCFLGTMLLTLIVVEIRKLRQGEGDDDTSSKAPSADKSESP